MEITGPHEISNRTYERGVFNETMACGTGATASAAVSLLLNLVKPGPVKVTSLGGTITIDIDKEGNAQMTGPASAVFKGELAIEV
jgi:diaminopimelate epimerase